MTDEVAKELKYEVRALTGQLKQYREVKERELDWLRSHTHLATKKDLESMELHIMSAISDWAARQKTFTDRIDTAVAGLTDDVRALRDEINRLQTSPGAITPEDQALLDGIQTRSEAVATKLEALDQITPPAPPPPTAT